MKYFKVISKTKRLFNKYNSVLIVENELLTEKEFEKILQNEYFNFNKKDFATVKVNKNKTGFLFGARFEF